MNAYILRAKPHSYNREDEFLDGRISIGWPCDESFKGLDRDKIARTIAYKYPDLSEVSISMIDLFVHMPKDSIVLVPSIQDKSLIHIFKTISGYKYDELSDNNDRGNPHFIDAEYLETVPRISLPNQVLKSLSGARKTLSRISQHTNILNNFIKSGFEKDGYNKEKDSQSRGDAINILYDLLKSKDENIRLNAAVAIIGLD